MWSMIAFFFLFFLFFFLMLSLFLHTKLILSKNYLSKDTGYLSLAPLSDTKLYYTPEWDDDVHPHQFHMGYLPPGKDKSEVVAACLTVKFSLQFSLCMLVNQRGKFTLDQKSHRAFFMLFCSDSKTISLLDSNNNNLNAPDEQILQTSEPKHNLQPFVS